MGHLGAVSGRLGAILGRSWAVLGSLGAILAPSWAVLGPPGAILGPLGRILGPLGAILGRSWGLLGRLGGDLGALGGDLKTFKVQHWYWYRLGTVLRAKIEVFLGACPCVCARTRRGQKKHNIDKKSAENAGNTFFRWFWVFFIKRCTVLRAKIEVFLGARACECAWTRGVFETQN